MRTTVPATPFPIRRESPLTVSTGAPGLSSGRLRPRRGRPCSGWTVSTPARTHLPRCPARDPIAGTAASSTSGKGSPEAAHALDSPTGEPPGHPAPPEQDQGSTPDQDRRQRPPGPPTTLPGRPRGHSHGPWARRSVRLPSSDRTSLEGGRGSSCPAKLSPQADPLPAPMSIRWLGAGWVLAGVSPGGTRGAARRPPDGGRQGDHAPWCARLTVLADPLAGTRHHSPPRHRSV